MNLYQLRTRRGKILAGFLLSCLLASCGSGNDSSIADTESTSDLEAEQSELSSGDTQGEGTITIGSEIFTFDLRCVFSEPNTSNDDVSISIDGQPSGSTPSDIAMSFTEQWGIDFSTGEISKDAPVYQSISIYKNSGQTLLYEYISITRDPDVTKPLNVIGKTISGPADFIAGDSEDPFASSPGEVSLKCE